MTIAVALHPIQTLPATPPREVPPAGWTLRSLTDAACDVAAELDMDDPRWNTVGPQLTAFVHATRLAAGMPGSPIRPDEAVAVVLRLRDLARLARVTAASAAFATPEAEARLRSLQVAAASR